MEMSVEEQEQETMQAMNEAVGIVEGKEQATLDLLLDMLGQIQKDEMLKKEAEAFVQQVMEEEQAESAEELRRAEAAKAQTDAFEKEWVERVRGKLQVVQEGQEGWQKDGPCWGEGGEGSQGREAGECQPLHSPHQFEIAREQEEAGEDRDH